jgi:two-component system catabolic regulation response regulator CreB
MTQEPLVLPTLAFAPPVATLGTTTSAPIRVLLIEDEPEAADLVQFSLLEDTGFDFEWARNLVEATIRLSQPGVDVVLLDLGLPELGGYKSYRVVELASGSNVPIVILTADDRNISRELTMGLGASDYLLKHEMSPARLKHALRDAAFRGRPQTIG